MVYFVDEHDFKKFPELTNSDLSVFGFMSPHVQITEDFEAYVVRVHDGDTVTLRTNFRDFDFPLRFASIDTPELNTGTPGIEARDFLKSLIENKIVTVRINPDNRVDKYGRLLGDVVIAGQVAGEILLQFGFALPFERRLDGSIPNIHKCLRLKQWF